MGGQSKSSSSGSKRRRYGLVGGGRKALEILAQLCEEPDCELVRLWAPVADDLVHRMGDLGFALTDQVKVQVTREFDQFNADPDFNLVIHAASGPQIKASLWPLYNKGVRVISGQAAEYLWWLRKAQKEELTPILEAASRLMGAVDLAREESEFFEILLQVGLYLTGSHSGDLYLVRSGEGEPLPVYSTTPDFDVIQTAPDGRCTDPPCVPASVQQAAILKRPVRLQETSGGVATGATPIDGSGQNETEALAVPLMAEGDLLGVMRFVQRAALGTFTQAETSACSRLADAAGRSLKKYQAILETRERSIAEMLRSEIKEIMSGSLTLEPKLAAAAEKIREVLGGAHVHLYVSDRSSTEFVLKASTYYAPQLWGGMKVQAGDGIVGEVARKRRPVMMRSWDPSFANGNLQCLIWMPLQASGRMCGCLCLEQVRAPQGANRLLKMIGEIADTLAQAVSAQLEQERMQQKLLKLSVVQEEGLELLSITDRERLYMMITASAAMLVDAETAVLRVFEKGGNRLLVGSTYGLHKNETDARLVDLDGKISYKVLKANRPMLINNLSEYDPSLPAKFPYRFCASRGIEHEGGRIGTLSVYNKLSAHTFGCVAFDEDDLEILEKLSYYACKALKNVQEAQARSALITIDELTGLRNERYLMLRLPEELRRAERYQRSLSLMIFEAKAEAPLPHDKGSSAEKVFIKQVSEVLQDQFRNVDILVRMTGARFAILMPDTGERVSDAVTRLTRGLSLLPLKLFIGYATYPGDSKTAKAMIQKASKLSQMAEKA